MLVYLDVEKSTFKGGFTVFHLEFDILHRSQISDFLFAQHASLWLKELLVINKAKVHAQLGLELRYKFM